jgi:hypothetical protein
MAASGTKLRATIAAKLAGLSATPRVVQFRQQTRTGGNSRLGIGGSVSVTDTLADPQPAVQMVKSTDILASGSNLIQPGDWEFLFAGTLPEATIRQSQILFGDTEVLNIVHYEPYALNNLVVAWRVIGRTVRTQ